MSHYKNYYKMSNKKEFWNKEQWIANERNAFELITVTGHLWYKKSVELVIFRKKILDVSVSEILKIHDYSENIINTPVNVEETLSVAKELLKMDITKARFDIGTLAYQWRNKQDNYINLSDFLEDVLVDFIGSKKTSGKPKDVVLYGFGRIGRLLARDLIYQYGRGEQLRLKAIVTRSNTDKDIAKRAALMRTDSVHGEFKGIIKEDLKNKRLIINGIPVEMIAADDPTKIDYTKYGINNALLIDNTGVWRDRDGLGLHLQAKGIDKVLLTAPGKGDIPNIVYGVNHKEFDYDKETIFSAASCTTNAIVPPLYVIEKEIGIERGHLETIHSYTNDQNLLDNYHKKYRRGRSAPINMVITETGASKAAAKVIPTLQGKLTANAVRVPTPNGSLAILMLSLKTKQTVEDINKHLENAAQSYLVEEMEYSYSNELVSSDIVGIAQPSIVDSKATVTSADGMTATIYVWYDNEYGYSKQVIRLAKDIAKVRFKNFY
jgi:glyceraldehyde 3-phosphate dehydrogenase